MSSSNPVSPKVVAAGLWAAVTPAVVALVLAVIDWILNSGPSLFPTVPPVVWPALSVVGALVGSYLKTDGLRIPTIDSAEVDKLDAPVS